MSLLSVVLGNVGVCDVTAVSWVVVAVRAQFLPQVASACNTCIAGLNFIFKFFGFPPHIHLFLYQVALTVDVTQQTSLLAKLQAQLALSGMGIVRVFTSKRFTQQHPKKKKSLARKN